MKQKLNNKGLTAIEVLICFSIVMVIVTSMLKVITNQRNRQSIESTKSAITTFKNTAMKTIYDDIKTNGGISEVLQIESLDNSVILVFKLLNESYNEYNSVRTLIINYSLDCNSSSSSNNCQETNYIEYKKGSAQYEQFYGSNGFVTLNKFTIPDIYDLKFNEPNVEQLTYSNNNTETLYLKIYVRFYHPDLSSKYTALDFILPIE